MDMQYRRLGRSGLRVSVLSLGSWVTFGTQVDTGLARDCLAAAYAGGVNFFDNAEVYAGGESERIMGQAIAELGWERYSYVLSSKFFWGIDESVNTRNTLNRKYLMHAVDRSLERLGHDFIDLIFCHRQDPQTPVEETVFAMHEIITSGRAHYWGTSEWGAEAIREAYEIAERHHLHKPVMEQPQYNLLQRDNVERHLAPLCEEFGLGLTTWSPLSSGVLSGKYLDGVPEGSRATVPGYEWLRGTLTNEESNRRTRALVPIAKRLDVSMAQLAIAWCAANPQVSTVITGASRVAQVEENLGALAALERLTPAVKQEIDALFA